MIIICNSGKVTGAHQQDVVIGRKFPYTNRDITHGLCLACAKWYDAMLDKMEAEK